jgi:hypothetical protein
MQVLSADAVCRIGVPVGRLMDDSFAVAARVVGDFVDRRRPAVA